MAFDRKRLGGAITPSSKNYSMFLYASDVDATATIAGSAYFAGINGKTPTVVDSEHIVFINDIVQISATDGFAIGRFDPFNEEVILLAQEV